jgi:hypothetical protein
MRSNQLMSPMAANLTDADFGAIAEYLARMQAPLCACSRKQLMGTGLTDGQIFNRIKNGKSGPMAAFGGPSPMIRSASSSPSSAPCTPTSTHERGGPVGWDGQPGSARPARARSRLLLGKEQCGRFEERLEGLPCETALDDQPLTMHRMGVRLETEPSRLIQPVNWKTKTASSECCRLTHQVWQATLNRVQPAAKNGPAHVFTTAVIGRTPAIGSRCRSGG